MNIGLVGVPGSGKTALAHTIEKGILHEEFSGCVSCMTPVVVIDQYAEATSADIDLVAGFVGDYFINLAIALARATRERKARDEGFKTIISCGTVLDTSVYAAMNGVVTLGQASDDAEREDRIRRIDASVKTLACLYMDTFHYDKVYYLPPLSTDGEVSEDLREMDKNLQVAFAAFNLVPVTPLVVEDGNMVEITQRRAEIVLNDILGSEEDESNPQGATASPQAAE